MYDNLPYPGYTWDEWETTLDNMKDSGRGLLQTDIDFLCKTYKIWHDFFFGADNKETDLEQIQPFTFSATCCINSDNRPFGGSGVTLNGYSQTSAHLVYPCVFDGYNCYYGSCTPVYAEPHLNQSTPQGQANLGEYMSYCNVTASGTILQCDRKNSSLTPYYNDRCLASFPNYRSLNHIMPVAWQAYGTVEQPYYANSSVKPFFRLWNNTVIYAGTPSQGIFTKNYDTLCFDLSGTPAYIDNNATPSSGYYKNFGSGAEYSTSNCNLIRPIVGQYGGAITTNIPRENISDNFYNTVISNSTYNTTYNYTTQNGDTITVYYGDTFISTGTGNTPISYDDLFNILTYVVDDLDVNAHLVDSNGNPIDLRVPTFEEIDYIDQGDFNITPLEQLPVLPSASDFDSTFDLSIYPELFSNAVKGYFDIFDALGMSALLAGVVLFVFLVRKLRGD